MTTDTISIDVEADAAKAYREAPAEDRRKYDLLLSLRLRELTSAPMRPLAKIMDELSAEAQAKGLTPELLEDLMRAE
jgi:hypothetical protein